MGVHLSFCIWWPSAHFSKHKEISADLQIPHHASICIRWRGDISFSAANLCCHPAEIIWLSNVDNFGDYSCLRNPGHLLLFLCYGTQVVVEDWASYHIHLLGDHGCYFPYWCQQRKPARSYCRGSSGIWHWVWIVLQCTTS